MGNMGENSQARGLAQRGNEMEESAIAAPQSCSLSGCLHLLFQQLEEREVRYCVLHSWQGLPEELPSDLDLAVHPGDRARLPVVFQELRQKGYQLVQCLNYFPQAYYFVLVWFEDLALESVAVDITFQYRRSGLISLSGEELTAGRQRFKEFWVASPATEFAYLLAKRTWKRSVPPSHARRLKVLAEKLGRAEAEKLAGKAFMGKLKAAVVEACANGSLDELLRRIGAPPWRTGLLRHPFGLARFLFGEAVRVIGRCLQPTGLFIVVLGPDGVGKSTLAGRLQQALAPCFRRHYLFHWRPMVISPQRKALGPTTNPQSELPRGLLGSVAALLVVFMDYWLGYALVLRPSVTRSGLVIFDRYFQDLLVDPRRYRYGGPMWLAKFLSRFVPRPELLMLVLDAEDKVILSRKREVVLEELRRQRAGYRQFTAQEGKARLIKTDQGIGRTVGEASRFIVEHLARRFERRHSAWLAPLSGPLGPS
jgi:thymidylate kinase